MNKKWIISLIGGILLVLVAVLVLVGTKGCTSEVIINEESNELLDTEEQLYSWILSERYEKANYYVEVIDEEISKYPALVKALDEADKHYGPPKLGTCGMAKGENHEGKAILNFLKSNYVEKYGRADLEDSRPYPYKIKYDAKYYGIRIEFSKNPPERL